MPRLRFPNFTGYWKTLPLQVLSVSVIESVGDRRLTPISISAGVGFVRQADKFGRDISGKQYRLYTYLQDGDFVYNKGNSISFPQGCVYQLQGWGEVAAPNVFFCFRFKRDYLSAFFQYCFEMNMHGLQLRKHITSGARSNGLLNVRREDFFQVRLPVPQYDEQRTISECLTSLDELINAEDKKLNVLKTHKKALLLQLFPAEGESIPRYRFPEFRDAREWQSNKLGEVFEISSGGTPDRSKKNYWNGTIPWVTTSLLNNGRITNVEEYISEEGLRSSSAKLFPAGTVLIAMYGQGKTRGKVSILDREAATNQACAAILPSKAILPDFVLMNLGSRYEELRSLSNPGGQENLSQTLLKELELRYPADLDEQEKIIGCLSILEEQMSGQVRRVELLKTHKKGLMQQLFPVLDEGQT